MKFDDHSTQQHSSDLEGIELERQKQHVLTLLNDFWDEASDEGVDQDLLAHAALFQALSSFVLAYGEEAVSDMCKNLSSRVMAGDYTVGRILQ
ncbi:hypothetical protein [Cohaesibacter gelatinilyticus]|uniref:Uncharacterized protein n=1 Tax=Cohaesibacter gelatinilyticus TaxID=372072 RepID=A0A285NK06_9HYPH|nr:hypothetical protein [Cohaesibacter gelatinilyticus]SNZ07981.1 hypothetical protein SAMN06265368_1370 [Cohaesibacter gelatinilyticus]